MKFGYARVSTVSQNLDTQINALKEAGCDRIIEEKKSGKDMDRPELTNLLELIREGDTLIVYDLSRLSRSIGDMINLIESFNKKNITLISLKDGYDASNVFSKYIVVMLSMVNDIQRTFQREKTIEGIKLAKANGRIGGRRPLSQDKKNMIWNLIKSGVSYSKTAEELRVSRRTVANVVKEFKLKTLQEPGSDFVYEDFVIPEKYANMKLKDIYSKNNEIENKKIKKEIVDPNQITLDEILKDYDNDYDNDDGYYDSYYDDEDDF